MTFKKLGVNCSEKNDKQLKYCVPNGAIYLAKVKEYIEKKSFTGDKSLAYIMNQEDSIDIDTLLDYQIAKTILTDKNNK